jgi:hypothetical protein
MKYLRLFLCLVALCLTACMSHLFVDTTTRLQVENKTDVTILGLDIISEDGTSVQPWIRDTVQPGEKSKVVEEDWVGTFRVRVRWAKSVIQENRCESVLAKEASDKKTTEVHINKTSMTDCTIRWDDKSYVELDFEGGSQYLVVTQDDDGKAVFKFK